MSKMQPPHPAPFSADILDAITELLPRRNALTIDPFVGIGYVHDVCNFAVGVDIEFDWARQAEQSEWTVVGDSLELPFRDDTFVQCVTSPCFGNRMADHHDAQEDSHRVTYWHYMYNATGHGLQDNNAGMLQWGREYREFHIDAWHEVTRVVERDFILHIGDHIRNGQVVPVSTWHEGVINGMGWDTVKTIEVPTQHMRYGANSDLRVENEQVILFRKGT